MTGHVIFNGVGCSAGCELASGVRQEMMVILIRRG
jgi:hypothetical protein